MKYVVHTYVHTFMKVNGHDLGSRFPGSGIWDLGSGFWALGSGFVRSFAYVN